MGRDYTEYEESSSRAKGAARPKLRGDGTTLGGVTETKWKMPASPGAPRRIHKPLGKKVKIRVQGDV